MNKKILFITIAAGVFAFSGAFGYAWMNKKNEFEKQAEQRQKEIEEQKTLAKEQAKEKEEKLSREELNEKIKLAMTQKQLKELIFEVREKVAEYDEKLEQLELREQRASKIHELAQKDIAELEKLRLDISTSIKTLKSEQKKLDESLINIDKIEQMNLKDIAETYNKMDSDSAGKIFVNMSQMPDKEGEMSFDDAAKILYYMEDRPKAKLLAALSNSEPKLAAFLSKRLKMIVETD